MRSLPRTMWNVSRRPDMPFGKFCRFTAIIFLWTVITVSTGIQMIEAAGKWHGFDGNDPARSVVIEQVSSDIHGLEFKLRFPGFYHFEKAVKEDRFVELKMPGCGKSGDIGSPQLPAFRRFVELPECANFSLQYDFEEFVTISLDELNYEWELMPVQPPVDKTAEAVESLRLHYDSRVYSQRGYISELSAHLSEPARARGHRLVLLEAFPATYDPSLRTLRIASSMSIKIKFVTPDEESTIRRLVRYRDIYFDRLIAAHTINPFFTTGEKNYPEFPPPAPPCMLIITAPEYENAVHEFAAWKQMTGYEVTLATTNETGTSTTEIKSYIQTAYSTWTYPPVYLLFVGDTDSIPAWNGAHSHTETDLDYSLLYDDDYLPDIALGRWPVRSVAQADRIVEKTLSYEKVAQADTTFYGQGVFLASDDMNGYAENTHNFVIDNYLEPYGMFPHRIWESKDGNTQDVIDNLNEGRSWCVYSGHGSPSGWFCVYFRSSHIQNDLTNLDEYPLVTSHACSTNTYEDPQCFGETWLVEEDKGGVAFWGASRSTQWDEDDIIEKAQFRGFVEEKLYSFSMTADYGKYDLVLEYGWAGNVYDYYDKYVVLGDPSLDPFTRIPADLNADFIGTAPADALNYDVHVHSDGMPVECALVNLLMNSLNLSTGYTDADGEVTLFVQPPEAGTMEIIVTAHNSVPFYGFCTIIQSGCGTVLLDADVYNCSCQAAVTVLDGDLNIDPGTPDSAQLFVFSDSEPAGEILTLLETGPDTNEFYGTVGLSDTEGGPGYLLTSHEETITVIYQDQDCEGSPADVYDTAVMDCQGPQIYDVQYGSIQPSQAVITWTTDEKADSVVFFGAELPPVLSETDDELTRNHSIILHDLDPCSQYRFYVASADEHGNISIDDNGGLYYHFSTPGVSHILHETLDSNPGWNISGGAWSFGQPAGQGGEYGGPDPASGYTGACVYGYNIDGDYENNMDACHLTTPPLDCSSASHTFLRFFRWLGVEHSQYDNAVLSVSNDALNWTEYFHNQDAVTDSDWTKCEYDISDTADGQPTVFIRWTMGPTDSNVAGCGWNIDDITVACLAPCSSPTLIPTAIPTSTPTLSSLTPITSLTPSPSPSPLITTIPVLHSSGILALVCLIGFLLRSRNRVHNPRNP